LQSGAYPVNPVATVPLAMTPTRLGREGNYLYAFGPNPGASFTLQAIDLGSYASPVEYGVIDAAAPSPTAGAAVTLPGDFPSIAGQPWGGDCYFEGDPSIDNSCPATGDMLVDGEFIYVASGQFLRIFSASQPLLPALIDTVDLSS